MFHAVGLRLPLAMLGIIALLLGGCGTTRDYQATEQLVVSDAVDRSVEKLDFRPLSGRKVYLDSSYLRQVKGPGFVNAEYVISALRQQILAAGCLLQDASNEAEIIIEARIGALGSDDHMVTYGIPENNALNSAAQAIPSGASIPRLPEISVARREAREAAAKIAAFAYDRETRKPVWQSGVRHSIATARSTWVLGVGPFQGGSIREKTKLVGSGDLFEGRSRTGSGKRNYDRPSVEYTAETDFNQGWPESEGVDMEHLMLLSEAPLENPPLPTPPSNNPSSDADASQDASPRTADVPQASKKK